MGAPVVHWEILSKNAEGLQKFFGELFDWHVDTNNPQGYGLVDTHSDKGIPGGIGAPQQGDGWVTVYVMVEDLQATLDRAESLGGRTIMPPMDVPGGPSIAVFADPEVDVVQALQGGYGSAQLIPSLDFDIVAANRAEREEQLRHRSAR